MCWGCCLSVYVAYSGFAFICFYPLVADPHLLPPHVDFMPASMAKMAGAINPIFYLWSVFVELRVFLKIFSSNFLTVVIHIWWRACVRRSATHTITVWWLSTRMNSFCLTIGFYRRWVIIQPLNDIRYAVIPHCKSVQRALPTSRANKNKPCKQRIGCIKASPHGRFIIFVS